MEQLEDLDDFSEELRENMRFLCEQLRQRREKFGL